MVTHTLPYAQVIILRKDIAEIIIDQGVEMDEASLRHLYKFLKDNLQAPFSLLFNKANDYAYSFEAQCLLHGPPEITAFAIVPHDRAGQHAAKHLINFAKLKNKARIFSDYAAALQWLEEQQSKVRKGGEGI